MKTKILILAALFISLTAQAQPLYEPAVDGTVYFRKKTEVKTPEQGMFFVRFGKSIASDSKGENSKNSVGSIGHRRIADTLIYGGEYNYHYAKDGTRFQNYSLNIGYRPDLRHRINPYLIGGFGLTDASKNKEGVKGGSGINYFVDFGVELWKIDMGAFHLRTMSGIKFTKEKLTDGPNPDMSFTDVYFGIGFGW